MRKTKFLLCLLIYASLAGQDTTIYLQTYEGPVRNPGKGFRKYETWLDPFPLMTLGKAVVAWRDFERLENDPVSKINDYMTNKWGSDAGGHGDIQSQNVKLVLKVILDWNSWPVQETNWNGVAGGNPFPDDLSFYDYSNQTPEFLRRCTNLIRKMGEALDNSGMIYALEMGFIGKWGEQHSPYPAADTQTALGDAFLLFFTNKAIGIRYPHYHFSNYMFGIYNGSASCNWGYDTETTWIQDKGDTWKTMMAEGEVAYNAPIKPGDNIGNWKSNSMTTFNSHTNSTWVMNSIRYSHYSALGWMGAVSNSGPAQARMHSIHKTFGYRLAVPEVSYNKSLVPGKPFTVTFKTVNSGSAPFYYNWPIELSLLDPMTKDVVWRKWFSSADIRKWLPGENFPAPVNSDYDNYRMGTLYYYSQPAQTNITSETFLLDKNVPSGEYIIALSVLDPSGFLPCLRFAISNYFDGGRHPVGYIGVNTIPAQTQIDPSDFDDLYSDYTLYYNNNGSTATYYNNYTNQADTSTRDRNPVFKISPSYIESEVQSVTIEGIPPSTATIYIFNNNGELITILENFSFYGQKKWNLRDSHGHRISTGVYFMKAGEEHIKFTVAK